MIETLICVPFMEHGMLQCFPQKGIFLEKWSFKMPKITLPLLSKAINWIKSMDEAMGEISNVSNVERYNEYKNLLESLQKIRDEHGSFGKRLTQLMQSDKYKISLRNLASISEIPSTTLHNWITDKAVPTDFEAVERLADYFNVSLSYLLVGRD